MTKRNENCDPQRNSRHARETRRCEPSLAGGSVADLPASACGVAKFSLLEQTRRQQAAHILRRPETACSRHRERLSAAAQYHAREPARRRGKRPAGLGGVARRTRSAARLDAGRPPVYGVSGCSLPMDGVHNRATSSSAPRAMWLATPRTAAGSRSVSGRQAREPVGYCASRPAGLRGNAACAEPDQWTTRRPTSARVWRWWMHRRD